MWDRYLSLGDIQAFSRVAGYFGKVGKQIEMRGVRPVSLANLRGRPVLLIGAFNNEWTLSLGGAPSDWRRNNMQVVLSAKVMSGTAGPPRVPAVHFW